MLVQAAQFFLNTLVEPYAWLLLARFHLQWLRAPMRNPLGEFIVLLTNPLVLPLRRIVPPIGMLDTATLLLAALMELACLAALLFLHDGSLGAGLLATWVVLRLVRGSIYLLMFALFLEALLSWTNPHAPFAPVLSTITGPFLRPLRRLVPTKGSVDFAFLILFFLCFMIVTLPLAWLELLIGEAIR